MAQNLLLSSKEKYIAAGTLGFIVIMLVGVFFFLLNGGKTFQKAPQNQSTITKPTPTFPPEENIMISNIMFQPERLVVKVGTTVDWMNFSDARITISSTNDAVNLGVIENNDVKSVKFTKPGEYEYFNKAKPTMKGVVVVQ